VENREKWAENENGREISKIGRKQFIFYDGRYRCLFFQIFFSCWNWSGRDFVRRVAGGHHAGFFMIPESHAGLRGLKCLAGLAWTDQ
jgi:hypothetical protein